MGYKLIAIDLDDTLLNKENKLTARTINTIKRIEKQGVKVIIATGRMLCSALPFIKELALTGPMITYNGAYVKDVSTKDLIYHFPLKADIAKIIIEEALNNNLHINLYQDDKLFVKERNKETHLYEKRTGIKANVVSSFEQLLTKEVTKLLIVEKNRQRYSHYLNMFTEKFSSQVHVTRSKNEYIEFMAKGIAKGKALELIATKLGIKQEQVIACGDSWNDLEMIKWAGLGVAMENSVEGVKKIADRIAPSNEQEGVASFLEEIFF